MKESDFAWLIEHDAELHDKYRGKWIAVHDGKIVGVGDTAPEAAAQGTQNCPNDDFTLEAIDHHTDVIYGSV